jgi:hypothetical protein
VELKSAFLKTEENNMDQVVALLSGNKGMIVTVLSLAFFAYSKIKSNADAGPIASKIQGLFDGAAKVLQVLSDILSSVLKSDGFLGKK